MKSFVIILSEKQPNSLTNNLLTTHVEYLKQLREKQHLPVCGPFTDNKGAVLIIRASSKEEAETLLKGDPFIEQGYYKSYVIHEFMEANDENDWLCDAGQTQSNLR